MDLFLNSLNSIDFQLISIFWQVEIVRQKGSHFKINSEHLPVTQVMRRPVADISLYLCNHYTKPPLGASVNLYL
jgi:hypothetical protein